MKRLYITMVSALTIFLFSCSSSYRSLQTTDDVYYSPDQNSNNYVGTQRTDDQENYIYPNSMPLGLYPSMGLWGSPYSSYLNFNLTFGNPYYSLFSPIYSPFNLYGYGFNYMNPFAFGYGLNSFYSPFGYGYYSGLYSPYSYYGSHGIYGNSMWLGSGIVKNNGPRITSATNIFGPGAGLVGNTNRNVLRSTIAPVRTFVNNPNNSGIIERNIPAPRMETGRANIRADRRAIRRFNAASESNIRRENIFSTPERRSEPVREMNSSPARTFERPAEAPRVIQSAPPVRSVGAPTRRF